MQPLVISEKTDPMVRLRVLVVDDEPDLAELVCDVLRQRFGCEAMIAPTIASARETLRKQGVELLITDLNLPDGNGMSLLGTLHELQPMAEALVITGAPSLTGAITALRQGAGDFLPKPFSADSLAERVDLAVRRLHAKRKSDRRLVTLRQTVRKLNEARKLVSRKVDLLCNDLISAYTDLSRQMESVRLQEGFRNLIGSATDLEELLCHTMDWLLRQLGYANVGIWLSGDDDSYNLGAYMKYTVPGDSALTTALERNLVRMVARKGFVHIGEADAAAVLTGPELAKLPKQDLIAANCTYLGDTLGVVVLFRDAKSPFTEEDMIALKSVMPLLAAALTRAVHASGVNDDEYQPPAGTDMDVPPPSSNSAKPRKKRAKDDPADWWKRGETPPF
jgi:FixJ family two-component response regulator